MFVSMFVSVTETSNTSGAGEHCDQPLLVFVSVTNLTNVTFHISHFFSGAVSETEVGTGQDPGGERGVVSIEDSQQKQTLPNLRHKEVFLLHDCS